MNASASVRAALGASLLDDRRPGWTALVHRPVINDTENCVLAHIYGDYLAGLAALGLSGGDAKRHGFLGNDLDDDATLEAAWVREISTRRGQGRLGRLLNKIFRRYS